MESLIQLKRKYGSLPAQRSPQWFENRKTTFGGSEMAALLGLNPYLTCEALITRKHSSNIKADPLIFGQMFERVAKKRLEHWSTPGVGTIHEFGSIPSQKYPVCYSADGIIVTADNNLRLLEIKCPIWRFKSVIPEYYKPQIFTGMDILPVKDCLFIQFFFRICSLSNLNLSTWFNRSIHKWAKPKCGPLYTGILHYPCNSPLIDIGNESNLNICQEVNPDNWNVHFWNRELTNGFPDFKTGYVIPFKCFKEASEIVLPEPDYLNNIREQIIQAKTTLDETWELISD